MEPTTQDATGKIIAALIIGLILGFAAGAFWQSRRTAVERPQSGTVVRTGETAAAAIGAESTGELPEEKKTMPAESAPATVSVPPAISKGAPVGAGTASLLVENQSAGATVEITRVAAEWPVWVAVRELKNGADGNILGAARVGAGIGAVVVELLRPTITKGRYAVVLYRDIGDPAFNYREDVLINGVRSEFIAE